MQVASEVFVRFLEKRLGVGAANIARQVRELPGGKAVDLTELESMNLSMSKFCCEVPRITPSACACKVAGEHDICFEKLTLT